MKDEDFLEWLATRLVSVYGESESIDIVQKTKAIAMRLRKENPNHDTKLWYKG